MVDFVQRAMSKLQKYDRWFCSKLFWLKIVSGQLSPICMTKRVILMRTTQTKLAINNATALDRHVGLLTSCYHGLPMVL